MISMFIRWFCGRFVFTVETLFLKDRIPPFPTPEALKFFESQFGLPASKVFAEISEKPIAAASLGQVYRGTWIEITRSPFDGMSSQSLTSTQL